MNEILNLQENFPEEDDFKIRPSSLADFQGKDDVKENLSIFLKASLERRETLDHVFLSGPPGLGKTTLASIISRELGAEFKVTSAPALEKPKDLVGILTNLGRDSVFFIDEVHRLKPVLEEMLYIAMEDFQIDWVIGQGPGARSVRIPIEPFTLIGATTRPGSVSSPLYSRFGINLRLDLYSEEDIKEIIKRSASILSIKITEDARALLAKCSRGTPRVANRILRRMRDFAQVLGNGIIDIKICKEGLLRLEIDSLGLESQDINILKTIIEKFKGGPVGGETLAISVAESMETLEDFYEPYLIRLGFLLRTAKGRIATDLAYEHLKIRKPTNLFD